MSAWMIALAGAAWVVLWFAVGFVGAWGFDMVRKRRQK